jgi:hypothetical protein
VSTHTRNDRPSELLDAMPPTAIESERALIGAALLLGRVPQDATIPAAHFYSAANAAIWQVMVELEGEHGRFDAAMLLPRLKALDQPAGVVWAAELAELMRDAGAPSLAGFHADQVRRAYGARTVGEHALQIFRESRNGYDPGRMRQTLDQMRGVLDGQDSPAVEPLEFTKLLSGADLLALDLRPRFLIRGVLVEGQPAIIGGRCKVLKTSIACDLVLSLGSGTPFLGRFDSQRVPVGFWSGESGAATIRETAQRQAAAKGIDLAGCDVRWCFDLPRLCNLEHLDALEAVIRAEGLRVAILDPLYLALLSAETASGASNIFLMGSMLQGLTRLGQQTNCTVVLLHHFRKGGQPDEDNPAGLEELAQSGVAEWARQWLLLQRRAPYQGDGRHLLWLRCGGCAGHGSLWGLTIDEGQLDPDTFTGRTWGVTVAPVADARAEVKAEQENRKAAEQERRQGENRERLLAVLRTMPEGDTERGLSAAASMKADTFRRAIFTLLQEGRAARCQIRKNGVTYDGFKPAGK